MRNGENGKYGALHDHIENDHIENDDIENYDIENGDNYSLLKMAQPTIRLCVPLQYRPKAWLASAFSFQTFSLPG